MCRTTKQTNRDNLLHNSLPESRPGGIQIDRKRLRKLREKKIAQGHKPDDHEEQWPQMTM